MELDRDQRQGNAGHEYDHALEELARAGQCPDPELHRGHRHRLQRRAVGPYAGAKRRCGGTDAWNLPAVFGPIAITFNVKTTDVLNFDAPTLAKIFSGAITRRDDPAITALNGNMPAEDIHVIFRSDDPN